MMKKKYLIPVFMLIISMSITYAGNLELKRTNLLAGCSEKTHDPAALHFCQCMINKTYAKYPPTDNNMPNPKLTQARMNSLMQECLQEAQKARF